MRKRIILLVASVALLGAKAEAQTAGVTPEQAAPPSVTAVCLTFG